MATLLHINVSPRGNYSISRQLGDAAVDAWKQQTPGGQVIERDLANTPLTFINLDWIAGAYTAPEKHNESHKKALALSDELIAELMKADEIVLTTPMYNFAVPAALKAWIDHVVRAGKTFRYTAAGKLEGLLTGKKLLAIIASGGTYKEAGVRALDHELPYLRFIFGFIGITDIQFIQASGTRAVARGQISPKDYLAPYLSEISTAVGPTDSPQLQ